MTPEALDSITLGLDDLASHVHDEVVHTGFYDKIDPKDPLHVAARAGLIASEIHEMIEELRRPVERVAERIGVLFRHEEEEAADVLIRLLDYCAWRGIRIGSATQAKLEVNRGRGRHFGGKRF